MSTCLDIVTETHCSKLLSNQIMDTQPLFGLDYPQYHMKMKASPLRKALQLTLVC